jgi:hypothetical protein
MLRCGRSEETLTGYMRVPDSMKIVLLRPWNCSY